MTVPCSTYEPVYSHIPDYTEGCPGHEGLPESTDESLGNPTNVTCATPHGERIPACSRPKHGSSFLHKWRVGVHEFGTYKRNAVFPQVPYVSPPYAIPCRVSYQSSGL